MKCCEKYNSGMLKSQLVIQRRARTSDGMGGYTEAWATIATVWAKFKAATGSERFQAMRVTGKPTATAVIRFRGDASGAPYYTTDDRISHRGKFWNVVGIADVEDRQQWLELSLEAEEAD